MTVYRVPSHNVPQLAQARSIAFGVLAFSPSGPAAYIETGLSVTIVAAVVTPTVSAHYKEAGGAAPLYTDDFNRADGASGWYHDGAAFTIVSNRLTRSSSGGTDFALFLQDIGSPDMYAEVDLYSGGEASGGGGTPYACLDIRSSSSHGQNCYMGYYNPTGDGGFSQAWSIAKMVGGSFSPIFSTDASGVGYPAQGSRLRFEAQGSALRLYLNGVLKVSTTDTTHTTGNYAGVNTNFITPFTSFDNFAVGILGVGGGGGPSLTASATVTSTDTYTAGGGAVHYNETGRSIPIVAVVTTVASAHYKESGGAAPSYTDDFNRANAGDLTTPWVSREGNHPISSNHVVVGSSSPNVSYYDATFPNDQYAEADFAGQQSVGFTAMGVCVRVVSSGDFYYFFPSGTHYIINKRVGGTYSTVATGTITLPSTYRARLEVEGTTLRLYVDGVLDITTTDTSIATGYPGILSANGTGATLDNFVAGAVGVGGGLSLTAAATVTSTNRTALKELALSIPAVGSVLVPIELYHRQDLALSVPGVVSVAETNQADFKDTPLLIFGVGAFDVTADYHAGAGAAHYDETGRSIPVAASVTTPPSHATFHDVLPVPIAFSIAVVADYHAGAGSAFYDETGLPISGVVAVTLTIEQADFEDHPLDLPVAAAVSLLDSIHYRELTTLSVPVSAFVSVAVDQADFHDSALSIPAVGTVTVPTESRKLLEPTLSIPSTGTVTVPTNRAQFREPPGSVTIDAFISRTDLQTSPGHYDETQKSLLIVANVTLVVEQVDYHEPGATVSIVGEVTAPTNTAHRQEVTAPIPVVATVTRTDVQIYHYSETALSVPVVATVTRTDVQGRRYVETSLSIPVVAAVGCIDRAHFGGILDLPGTADVTLALDKARFKDLARSIGILGDVALTVSGGKEETLTIPVTASVSRTDLAFYRQLELPISVLAAVETFSSLKGHTTRSVLISATVTASDFKSRVGITVLNDASALYLGNDSVDRVYVGATQAWP